jgi:hypothetical protein
MRGRSVRCTWHDSTVELTYFRSSDGAVYAKLGRTWRGFNELLSDAITPLPPIGSDETSLSTYWIDRATREVLRRRETGEDGAVQSGNATTLIVSGSMVIATSDYELLTASILRSPKTYRRNPYPS